MKPTYSDAGKLAWYTERNLCKEQLTGEEGKLCFPCS